MTPCHRHIIATLLLVASLPFAMSAWVSSHADSVTNTVRNNEILNAKFLSASYLVEEFYQLNHRLPTQADVLSVSRDKKVIIFYRPWLTQTDLEKISPMSDVLFFEVQGDVAKFPEEALTEFGSPPAASKPTYLLIDWGFDVPKCWASWLNRSTAITDTTKFYFLGSSFADTSLFSAIAGALACAGILIWQWPKPKISGVK